MIAAERSCMCVTRVAKSDVVWDEYNRVPTLMQTARGMIIKADLMPSPYTTERSAQQNIN